MKHTKLKIALACDHAGFVSKKKLVPELSKEGYSVSDYGIYSETPADYPDVAEKVALAVQDGRIGRGVLICGSGVGVSVVANKFSGVRAAVCHDSYSARQGVEHDNMNVLCLGSRVLGYELMKEITLVFLGSRFSGDKRYLQRLDKLRRIEQSNMRSEQP